VRSRLVPPGYPPGDNARRAGPTSTWQVAESGSACRWVTRARLSIIAERIRTYSARMLSELDCQVVGHGAGAGKLTLYEPGHPQ
jgi:hypothetical protein